MKIVLAQLKKDIQCQRTPLILWGICLGIGLALAGMHVALSHLDHSSLQDLDLSQTQKVVGVISFVAVLGGGTFAVMFGMFLLLPILVIRIVREDTLMGTTAFWLTRPIPREKLLLAKALFIAVLVLPLLVSVGNGARIGESQFWPAETAWIAALAALAAITPGVQALLGYGMALLFGKIIFSGIINAIWKHYHGASTIFPDGVVHVFSSAGEMFHLNASDLCHLCYFAGFSAVFIHQYLTLRTRKSLAIYIATLITVGVLQMLFVAQPTAPFINIQSSQTTP
jgi:hypothetical protein